MFIAISRAYEVTDQTCWTVESSICNIVAQGTTPHDALDRFALVLRGTFQAEDGIRDSP